MTRKLRLSDPHAELPIKNHKYVKNCTELYMANQRIDKIANFDAFVNLEVLWINGNQFLDVLGIGTNVDTCSGLGQENLAGVFRYLRMRGYAVSYNGFRFEGNAGDSQYLKSILPAPGIIQWKPFVQLFESKQLHCELLSPQELQQQAAACFDKCAVMQRRLQALNTSDAKSAQLVKESLELSQQGYHLQALADGDHSSSRSKSSRLPSSADIQDNWEAAPTSTQTRFYMTAFTREKTSANPSISASTDCSSKFSELKSESERISDALAGKYKIRHKDFTKYLAEQSPQTTKLVRRNYQL
ncbi:hypothetical protein PI124_g370 [Phytophthora idaei]|nr:hypothetical protein PI124_g370 [Phytophthora idaei]